MAELGQALCSANFQAGPLCSANFQARPRPSLVFSQFPSWSGCVQEISKSGARASPTIDGWVAPSRAATGCNQQLKLSCSQSLRKFENFEMLYSPLEESNWHEIWIEDSPIVALQNEPKKEFFNK